MSESKMHQSFEAFYGFKWMSVSDTAQQAWTAAWQVSRESLVAELPKDIKPIPNTEKVVIAPCARCRAQGIYCLTPKTPCAVLRNKRL